ASRAGTRAGARSRTRTPGCSTCSGSRRGDGRVSGPAPAPDPRTSRDATPPGTAALLLRPVGYLAIGLVWTTIGLFVVGLSVALAAYGLFEPPADQEPWAELVASPGAVL